MNGGALERVFRAAGGRIIAALAVRFRDLSLAEDAFAESCLRAVRSWPEGGVPANPAAWLYRVSERVAIDTLRKRRAAPGKLPDALESATEAPDSAADDRLLIPDERLRLIFVCCHPAIASDARVALTLRLICGLTTTEIARAFLLSESALAQRLVRAKRKIAEAGVSFEVPLPAFWDERLEAVLATLEVAYAKAHEDAAASGPHAGFAAEVLHLSSVLTELLPSSGEVLALAALVRYAEARRPARVDSEGMMVPLAEQDPRLWRREFIAEADLLFARAQELAPGSTRVWQAALQRAWCSRRSLAEPPPWREVLELYDRLLTERDDPVVRVNRAVALAEAAGHEEALRELDAIASPAVASFLPYWALRADLHRRAGRTDQASSAYAAALALDPSEAERRWLEAQAAALVPAAGSRS